MIGERRGEGIGEDIGVVDGVGMLEADGVESGVI